jgi:Mn2+/Fe2+ NRAMP family transporter
MKRVLAVTLGILTAIGGFVDIGDLVTNALVGARFGLHLAWVVVVGVAGICVFAEMSGRIAAVSGRPTFDLVRERLGPRTGLLALLGSFFVTALTMAAELGGVALVLELLLGWDYLLFVPFVAVLVWLVIWKVTFRRMETTFGLLGLLLVVYAVAVWAADPDWGRLWDQARAPQPTGQESWPVYWYYAVALFGAAMTPYEVFFFSSGGVEEGWTRRDLATSRLNVFVGFPLGGVLSLSIAALAAVTYLPVGIEVDTLGQTALPVAAELGTIGLLVVLLGIFAATFGAALETALSTGYAIAQYFGWPWGKMVRPRQAPRFHTLVIVALVAGTMLLLTTVDPVKVTEYSVVFSALALPLTYLPILVVSNDPDYLGDDVNGPVANALGMVFLGLVVVASVAALPLMIWTKAGQ